MGIVRGGLWVLLRDSLRCGCVGWFRGFLRDNSRRCRLDFVERVQPLRVALLWVLQRAHVQLPVWGGGSGVGVGCAGGLLSAVFVAVLVMVVFGGWGSLVCCTWCRFSWRIVASVLRHARMSSCSSSVSVVSLSSFLVVVSWRLGRVGVSL